jgi:hypothetical protein
LAAYDSTNPEGREEREACCCCFSFSSRTLTGSAAHATKRTSGRAGWSGPCPAARRRSLKPQSQTRKKAEMVRRWME